MTSKLYFRAVLLAVLVGIIAGKTCIQKAFLDGTETKIECPGECCGMETLRYCCPRITLSDEESCSKKDSLTGDTETITCSNGCCGSDLGRYCCIDLTGLKDFVGVGTAISTTWIIVIVVICVVVVAIIVGVIICCCCCCRKAASTSKRPGLVVVNGQGHPNAAYISGNQNAYPLTSPQPRAPQGYSDPKYGNVQQPGAPKGYAAQNKKMDPTEAVHQMRL